MAFSFLPCADLHLGSPFLGLALKDEALAARFAAASREAFSALVDAALAEKVAFVLIAGDVYDGEWRDTSIGLFFNREMGRLARAGIPVYLVRGNHDAASEVTKSITLPRSVHEFPSNRAQTLDLPELRVAIHGRSFPEREVRDDFAQTYPKRREGFLNIGLLHTSCTGSSIHQTYAPCTPAELAAYGYDYWALGHVHDFRELSRDPWIVYPGNLQGRSVRECGPKGAVFVDVEDGHIAGLRRIVVDRARWADVVVDCTGLDTEASILSAVEGSLDASVRAAEGRAMAVRISLSGPTALHDAINADPHHWQTEVQGAAHRLHEDVWLEKLQLQTRPLESEQTGPTDFDIAPLIDEVAQDAEVLRLLTAELDEIRSRHAFTDLAPLIEDARALLLGRLRAGGA